MVKKMTPGTTTWNESGGRSFCTPLRGRILQRTRLQSSTAWLRLMAKRVQVRTWPLGVQDTKDTN